MSVRDDIDAGPKWKPWLPLTYAEADGSPPVVLTALELSRLAYASFCAACREGGATDTDTRLCRSCWRVWRFGR